ncbi:PD-(D/E)XK nuclease family transposase [Rosistilla oblonga]|uniref:Rpn family recombination-promoting nuclease/putative transposase n=1 Tax=Rosistilla oblonga TaxID=2527990 RepID=UPI00118CD88D|nr:Rpn family recombination-promoting nuclease/putative transposase [Rosistilla oblonga]QDV10566.1 PD-(D/E)XK nuclease family transposase [Rosistilla oblonga]
MALGISPLVDFAFKMIFGSPESAQALIGLLNAVLDRDSPITEVEILNPFNYQEFADAKQIVLDVRARDDLGRSVNVEMQVARASGLLQRMTYYACSLYTDQLERGNEYWTLRPAISICFLNDWLFRDTAQQHHRFEQTDRASGRRLPAGIEVHTIELPKYNLVTETISRASRIEQWVFFLLRADRYSAAELQAMLPGLEFHAAISVVERIASKTEDRVMYDQREKAIRDQQWLLSSARQEGEQAGVLAGQIQLLQRLLQQPEQPLEELLQLPTEKLTAQHTDLQSQARLRNT